MLVKISKSKIEGKKLTATFYDSSRKPITTNHSGATGYPDYTITHDAEMRK